MVVRVSRLVSAADAARRDPPDAAGVVGRLLLVTWAFAPTLWLASTWLFEVPPVWGLGFLMIGYGPHWLLGGAFLALVVGATGRFWRTAIAWTLGGLVGVAALFLLLQVPLAWRLPTAVERSWDRWGASARASDQEWFLVPGASSLNSDGYFVRASHVDEHGVGQVLLDDRWPLEFEPRYQEHDRSAVPGVQVYVSYPADEGWWYVWRR